MTICDVFCEYYLLHFTSLRHILSVTVRIRSDFQDAIIHYTTDGTKPSRSSPVLTSNAPLLLNTVGDVTVQALASLEGMLDSLPAKQTYTILDRCETPVIYPNGGTYAGSVGITLSIPTTSAPPGPVSICYSLDKQPPTVILDSAQCISNGDTITLDEPGTYVLRAVSMQNGFADSSEASANFTVLAQVSMPHIGPDLDTFAISATLLLTCSTPGATIYYTTDGSDPTQSSLTVTSSNPAVVIESAGSYLVKAFATQPNMLPSNIVVKEFTILARLAMPQLQPPPGATYTGNLNVQFDCADVTAEEGGVVYYSTDGRSTPSVEYSKHVPCGAAITLEAPGTKVVRAIATGPAKSPSSVAQGSYVLVRPAYDELPVNPAHNEYKVEPDVEIIRIEKDLNGAIYYCPKRSVSGRLVKLRNPVGHFEIVPPAEGCDAGRLERPSVSGRVYRPPPD